MERRANATLGFPVKNMKIRISVGDWGGDYNADNGHEAIKRELYTKLPKKNAETGRNIAKINGLARPERRTHE